MPRRNICAISFILFTFAASMSLVSASNDSLSSLNSLISGFDDPSMGVRDLAFYLVTHNFDATPHENHVTVDLGGKMYKLTPNGLASGLCDIVA